MLIEKSPDSFDLKKKTQLKKEPSKSKYYNYLHGQCWKFS